MRSRECIVFFLIRIIDKTLEINRKSLEFSLMPHIFSGMCMPGLGVETQKLWSKLLNLLYNNNNADVETVKKSYADIQLMPLMIKFNGKYIPLFQLYKQKFINEKRMEKKSGYTIKV